ncbi:MAG: DUF4254 domain-containing protein [Spirochaetota bacterium]
MFPESKKINEISKKIVSDWHIIEDNILSLNDALSKMSNINKSDIYYHIELLSLINTALWHEEDKARDPDADDSNIADVKRKIDKLNAMRVNKVEEIDKVLYQSNRINNEAPINSETVASIIDRLSILALKKYHMEYEANRKDAPGELRNKCAQKLIMINGQLIDLTNAYDQLIEDIKSGSRRYALYGQFKMYNDPELNPAIYKKS